MIRSLWKGAIAGPPAAMLMIVFSGCGEMADTDDATNRGSGSETQGTTVENAFIVPNFLPGRCAIQLGTGARLRFTVTNVDSANPDRLVNVSTDIADRVEVSTTDIPVRSSVGFGQPAASTADGRSEAPAASLGPLDRKAAPGMSADVTFHFERAGDISMPVPIEACPAQKRDTAQ